MHAQKGLKAEDLYPSNIQCQRGLMAAGVQSVAFTNATLSACRGIRRAHDALTWFDNDCSQIFLDGAVQFVDQFDMGNVEPDSIAVSTC